MALISVQRLIAATIPQTSLTDCNNQAQAWLLNRQVGLREFSHSKNISSFQYPSHIHLLVLARIMNKTTHILSLAINAKGIHARSQSFVLVLYAYTATLINE
jgi:hypothetical protein